MPISYSEALQIIRNASQDALMTGTHSEVVPLSNSVGSILQDDLYSPVSTPAFDSSAMDGYAVNSDLTTTASVERPVLFRVHGTTAAGDDPITLSGAVDEDGSPLCVEIMTGAQFPLTAPACELLDACIPIEHTRLITSGPQPEERFIEVTRPIRRQQHRRPAGGDFSFGQKVIGAGQMIEPHHVMAVASLGVKQVAVRRQRRVGVWSTGAELLQGEGEPKQSKLYDANGPFLTASLRAMGFAVEFLGILKDDPEHIASKIASAASQFDVLITSGAVSAGKFDFVHESLVAVGAEIRFHKVAIRPGHPVLFALLPVEKELIQEQGVSMRVASDPVVEYTRRTAFFGLPGNPIATAACFRMIVTPYLQQLSGRPPDKAVLARLMPQQTNGRQAGAELGIAARLPTHLDVFRHGSVRMQDHELAVELSEDQGPAKVRPFSQANCWVHVPKDHGDLFYGDLVNCFPLVAGGWFTFETIDE